MCLFETSKELITEIYNLLLFGASDYSVSWL